ncbi:MAG: PAS domain-containing sensor histidine kinase [Janthinobacterium lividum]
MSPIAPASDPFAIFNALPGAFLLLSPAFLIEAASEEYLAMALLPRAQLVGRYLFEVFPDNPAAPEAHGERNLRASLTQVLATGRPHEMAPQHYDVPDPTQPGRFLERHWLPRNAPVLDAQGRVEYLIHTVVDITVRHRADAQLRESQARELAARAAAERQRVELQRVFEQAPVAIAVYRGPEYVIELANPTVCRLWGRTQSQLIGRGLFEALPEVAGMGYEELLDEVLATGVPYVAREMPAVHERHGRLETVYWTFVYQPLREADGQITGTMVVATDVTTMVLARQQLELLNQELETRVLERTDQLAAAQVETERQRAQLHSLFLQAPAAICILSGPELVYELVNPGYQALFPGRELLGRPLLDALPEIAGNRVYETFRQVYETGRTHEEQALLIPLARPGDGRLEDRYFQYVQQARTTTDGQVDGVLVFAFEVTEQVRARQQAEAGERRLQLLTDALPVLISYIDLTFTYRFVNQAYEAWFHRTPAEIIGHSARELVGPAAYARVEAQLVRALAGERVEWQATMPYRPGFTRHVQGSLIPDIKDGQVQGIYNLLSDVTELVEARHTAEASTQQALALAETLGQTNQQLTRTNIDLDNFIYTASHDLRAPITNIEGLVLALREQLRAVATTPDAVVPQLLDMMQGAVERFQTTIAQLTDIARLQQAHDLPIEQVAVAEVVEAVRLDLASLLTQANAQLTVELAPNLRVSFAPKNLRSVVYNLLSNAIKYHHSDRRPVIHLRAERREQDIMLTVQDNGLGLDAQQQGQLFGLFRRLHTHVEGTGVGLYMVKRMVENAGGTITVQSQPAVGTIFCIHLPA